MLVGMDARSHVRHIVATSAVEHPNWKFEQQLSVHLKEEVKELGNSK